MESVTIYTDGSSRGNPGPGGYGAIIISNLKPARQSNSGGSQISEIKEIGGRENKTTNNRMEMKAVIAALRSVPDSVYVEVYADSEYLIKGITDWVYKWQQNGWRTKDKKDVLNQDLWQELLFEVEKRNVEWMKVAGHSGHKYNDRCDTIATSFADGKNIKLFEGGKDEYEKFLS